MFWTISSAVEHFVHIEGVAGSNPASSMLKILSLVVYNLRVLSNHNNEWIAWNQLLSCAISHRLMPNVLILMRMIFKN